MAIHPILADDMQEIVESFLVETRELFEDLDNDILKLESGDVEPGLIDQIFRSVHTVKGTSGFLDLEQLSELAHHFEDVLNKIRKGTMTVQPGTVDVLLAAFDQMRVLVQQVVDRELTPIDLGPIVGQLMALSDGAADESGEAAEATPSGDAYDDLNDEEFAAAVAAAQEEAEARAAQEEMEAAIAAALAEMEGGAPETAQPEAAQPEAAKPQVPKPEAAQPEAPKPAQAAPAQGKAPARTGATETIRVPVNRLDALMDLVGELVLSRNRLLQLLMDANSGGAEVEILGEVRGATAQLDFVTTELQTAVMQTRMVQIGRVFARFPRLVRDLAADCGKKVDLVLEGEDTELDKSLTEEIADPLIHLVRNALDHGVETPEARVAAGKPARGRVRLAAAHEGDHILIVIQDDGAGIDPEKIKAKAVEKGLITEQEATDLSEAEAYQLIFRPGFSTAQTVSQVSGRGVGMDVVKTNLARLNGSVTIASELGVGTTFTLKLPLTLAIIQSLLVRVGGETFGLPLHAVDEVVGLELGRQATIRGREVLRHRDEVVPLIRISDALHVKDYVRPEGQEYAVVVEVAHQRIGLIVDALIGQKEIVIKPLGDFLKKPPSIAGSAILGDGRVVMVLDLGQLVGRRDLAPGTAPGGAPASAPALSVA